MIRMLCKPLTVLAMAVVMSTSVGVTQARQVNDAITRHQHPGSGFWKSATPVRHGVNRWFR